MAVLFLRLVARRCLADRTHRSSKQCRGPDFCGAAPTRTRSHVGLARHGVDVRSAASPQKARGVMSLLQSEVVLSTHLVPLRMTRETRCRGSSTGTTEPAGELIGRLMDQQVHRQSRLILTQWATAVYREGHDRRTQWPRRSTLAAVLVSIGLWMALMPAPAVEVEEKAQDFPLQRTMGGTIQLSECQGKKMSCCFSASPPAPKSELRKPWLAKWIFPRTKASTPRFWRRVAHRADFVSDK